MNRRRTGVADGILDVLATPTRTGAASGEGA
jgi:hypothetical protein